MPEPGALAAIRTFPQLVAYLRDELGWPINSTDFELLTYDYTPEELGIDAKTAAKIEQIRRLRPLSVHQPFGIFFVKFEPKRLPIVALREILRSVVVKKRTSANPADRAVWQLEDLLFISDYGDREHRQISFAQFSQMAGEAAPRLRVLGWDDQDTPLKLADVEQALRRHLRWPDDISDTDTWRLAWRGAFTLGYREVITTARDLSARLASLARRIRSAVLSGLEVERTDGRLTMLLNAFRESLIHEITVDEFADMFAQTIAYGLLSARVAAPAGGADSVLPVGNPFIRDLMRAFLRDDRDARFGDLGIAEVVEVLDAANIEAVIRDFGNRNPDEDPVIHFYEQFLKDYDAKKRMQRGVFYTPQPVVAFVVRAVDRLLQERFGLADGLADTSTWADVCGGDIQRQVPTGVMPSDPFVRILDPAVGTGTFLVEVIDLIYRRMAEKWRRAGMRSADVHRAWNEYVPRHLLPRLFGYELLMAPYAIAHLKVGLKLRETGYEFGTDERARIYLTNSLEPAADHSGRLAFAVPALADEAAAVNAVKAKVPFTVILGNPPYSASMTESPAIAELMSEWKRDLHEAKVDVMREEWKFLRMAQAHMDRMPLGVTSFVINRDFLDGITKRRMRESLAETFPAREVIDLNGDVKGEISDENVFEIQQGVCIAALAKGSGGTSHLYSSLEGTRAEKFAALNSDLSTTTVTPIEPHPPLFLWRLRNEGAGDREYESWLPLNEVFDVYSSGIQTQRDGICFAFSEQELWERIQVIANEPSEAARRLLDAGPDGTDWRMENAKRDVLESGTNRDCVTPVLYRPFDVRFTYWTGKTKGFHARPRREVMRNVVGRANVGLVFNRQVVGSRVSHFALTSLPTAWGVFYLGNKGSDYLAPLYSYAAPDKPATETLFGAALDRRTINLSSVFRSRLGPLVGSPISDADAEAALYCLYAVLSSPTYRSRYALRLKEDFAHVPVPKTRELFDRLHALGRLLAGVQDVNASVAPGPEMAVPVGTKPEVGSAFYLDGTVWFDRDRRFGLRAVPREAWEWEMGGYPVIEKWLKSRKGQILSPVDLEWIRGIATRALESVSLAEAVDEAISTAGGWPDAFAC